MAMKMILNGALILPFHFVRLCTDLCHHHHPIWLPKPCIKPDPYELSSFYRSPIVVRPFPTAFLSHLYPNKHTWIRVQAPFILTPSLNASKTTTWPLCMC